MVAGTLNGRHKLVGHQTIRQQIYNGVAYIIVCAASVVVVRRNRQNTVSEAVGLLREMFKKDNQDR